MNKGTYTYDYPRPSVTTDCVIFGFDSEGLSVLLIERGIEPFKGCWAFPGGFMQMDEDAETCARRELEEETGVTGMDMKLVGVYSKPGRDPRGWTVSAAYTATVRDGEIRPVAGDDAREVCWVSAQMEDCQLILCAEGKCVNDELAFDHYEIITDAYSLAIQK